MASGFGWYSLSGILLTESFGPVIGSAAFFNDLCRELLAIMLIPGLVRRSRSTALGLCGATSMDFTLPVPAFRRRRDRPCRHRARFSA
jgi:uncharacterized membrane protein YbjE (DUF340 family)